MTDDGRRPFPVTAGGVPTARLDGRVTNERGQPVRTRQAASPGGWWWRIRRAPGPDGVELVARVPGYDEVITPYATEAAADAAAVAAYAGYQADVESAARGIRDAVQEAS
jgi:hypothetical protein